MTHWHDNQIAHFKANPDKCGLCSWCRCYWNRATGSTYLPKLTDEQFEATRHDGTSHGCCPTCVKKLKTQAKES